MTVQEYISRHEFLRPIVETQAAVDRIVDGLMNVVKPFILPSVEECQALTAEGLPLLQHSEIIGRVKLFDNEIDNSLVTKLLRQQNDEIDCEPIVRLIVWNVIERLLPNELKASDCWTKWRRNYCPICGRLPVMAQLRKEMQGRARFLTCDGCRTAWEYNRLGCVYCGNDDLKSIHIFEIESEPNIRLDVCDKCRAYLKTYNREGEEPIYLNDRLTLHFDLLAEDEGVHKCGSIMTE